VRGVVAICMLALVCAASADAAPPKGLSVLQWGEQLFGANCVTCHGPNGRGLTSPVQGAGDKEGLGPSLVGVGAQAADFYLRTGYMPLHNVNDQPRRSRVLFTKGELAALVAYVSSLGQGPRIPKPNPRRGHLAEGQALFTEHCAGCHQIDAEGGYVTNAVAPALDKASPVEIAEAVRIGPYLMPHFSEQQISDDQLNSIIRYVQYAKHPDDRGGWSLGHVGPVPEGLVTWFVAIALLVAICGVIGQRIRS
jgi:ubiquinol-cytochrome c reductase cytochrome c subunit